jgi:hypothetical protein
MAIRLSGEAVQVLTLTGPFLAEPTPAWLLQRRRFTLTEGFAATISIDRARHLSDWGNHCGPRPAGVVHTTRIGSPQPRAMMARASSRSLTISCHP